MTMEANRISRSPDAIIEEYRITTDDLKAYVAAKCSAYKEGVKTELTTVLWDKSRKDLSRNKKRYVLTMLGLSDEALQHGSDQPGLVKDILMNSNNVRFVDEIWAVIVNMYRYDRKELIEIRRSDKLLDRLEETLGITEEQLKELIKVSQPHIHDINGDKWVILAVRPEKIIYDMLSNPDTKKINGQMVISEIVPITKERVEFVVHIHRGENVRQTPVNEDVIKILQNA